MAAADPQSGGDVPVSLQGVSKTFASGVTALDRFDLDLKPGEFVSLLGPSGCGKSTALRLIAGLMEPTRGTVSWSRRRPRRQVPPRADRLRVPGADADAVGDGGRQCPPAAVAAPSSMRRQTAERVAAALQQVGLDGFEHAYPRELSGGMKMRASIARALVTEPALLLMDEPFAALDEVTRFKLNDDLIALWRAVRRTVVFVTHSVFESVYLSERVVVMTSRPGRVFAEFKIDAPYPRDRLFRTSPDYAALCRQVSAALADASSRGGGA